ncbi:hypothetical protein [Winogradskyella sp.]|uniref:hypothetical protein n=1 Tax=Winogradskyella sp. TaxID=1883156 RepID=UPI003BA9E8E4
MKYDYLQAFTQLIKANSLLNLSVDQQERFMQVMAISYSIKVLDSLQKANTLKRLDLDRFKQQKKLAQLTGNIEPIEVFKEMVMLSRSK